MSRSRGKKWNMREPLEVTNMKRVAHRGVGGGGGEGRGGVYCARHILKNNPIRNQTLRKLINFLYPIHTPHRPDVVGSTDPFAYRKPTSK